MALIFCIIHCLRPFAAHGGILLDGLVIYEAPVLLAFDGINSDLAILVVMRTPSVFFGQRRSAHAGIGLGEIFIPELFAMGLQFSR